MRISFSSGFCGCSGSGSVGVSGIYHSPNTTAPILVY
nr:MAG TPA: hypothetical protein [Crassvirales sp.]DAK17061.1 MAG TPA: hypothetical protein [Caudoviricetes sp.]